MSAKKRRSEEHCRISVDTELVVCAFRHHLPHPKGQQGAWPQSRAQQESFCFPGHCSAQGRPVRSLSEHAVLLLGTAPGLLRALLVGHPGKISAQTASPAQRGDRCCPAAFTAAGLVWLVAMATAASGEIHASISEGKKRLCCSFVFE